MSSGSTNRRTITIRDLFSDTLIYGAAGVASRAIGFLLLPVTTAILDPKDYGVLGLFGATTSILWLLISLGGSCSLLSFLCRVGPDQDAGTLAWILARALPASVCRGPVADSLGWQRSGDTVVWDFGNMANAAAGGQRRLCDTHRIRVGTSASGRTSSSLPSGESGFRAFLRGIGLTLLVLGHGPWGWIVGGAHRALFECSPVDCRGVAQTTADRFSRDDEDHFLVRAVTDARLRFAMVDAWVRQADYERYFAST